MESPQSMEEFILAELDRMKRDEFVYALFNKFNDYRSSISKKHGLYNSFRAIISKLNHNKHIESTTPNRETPFAPSKYRITALGKRRLSLLRDSK